MGSKTALHTKRSEAFRESLRRARVEAGLTQEEVAALLRCQQT